MKREVAQNILETNRDSYDRMASEFSSTRGHFWSELAFLAEHATPGMSVLDIGCGNGRFYPSLHPQQIVYTGLDSSRGLLEEARKKYPNTTFTEGDATTLPFPDNSFDIAFSFATIHHIPGKVLQKKFITEAARVLKSGRTFILTAWYLWDPPYRNKVLMNAGKSALHCSLLDIGDVMLTFGKEKHSRYLHAFTEKALIQLVTENGFEVIGSEVVARAHKGGNTGGGKATQKNILVVAKKK